MWNTLYIPLIYVLFFQYWTTYIHHSTSSCKSAFVPTKERNIYGQRGPSRVSSWTTAWLTQPFHWLCRWESVRERDTALILDTSRCKVHPVHTHINTNIILWEMYQTAPILADNQRRHLLRYQFWDVTLQHWVCVSRRFDTTTVS